MADACLDGRRLKILVIVWDFFGGGAERVAVLLSNALSANGQDVVVLASSVLGPNRTFLDPNIQIRKPPLRSALFLPLYVAWVYALNRPDVVLSHMTSRNVVAIIAHMLAPGRNRRIVVGVEHGQLNQLAAQARGLGPKTYHFLAKHLYSRASAIVCVSQNVCSSVANFLRPRSAETRVLPNPVVFPGLTEMAAQIPEHPWLKEKSVPILISVGRLEDQKNHALLLSAFALLSRRTDARLIIFGEGALRSALAQQIVELGLTACVDLPGYTSNPFAAMRCSDVFVLSSRWEGLPTVAIEAMFCGCQVVSTRNSVGIDDILNRGELGRLVPSDDPDALAEGMLSALLSPISPQALTARALEFEASKVAKQYDCLFRYLLSRAGSNIP